VALGLDDQPPASQRRTCSQRPDRRQVLTVEASGLRPAGQATARTPVTLSASDATHGNTRRASWSTAFAGWSSCRYLRLSNSASLRHARNLTPKFVRASSLPAGARQSRFGLYHTGAATSPRSGRSPSTPSRRRTRGAFNGSQRTDTTALIQAQPSRTQAHAQHGPPTASGSRSAGSAQQRRTPFILTAPRSRFLTRDLRRGPTRRGRHSLTTCSDDSFNSPRAGERLALSIPPARARQRHALRTSAYLTLNTRAAATLHAIPRTARRRHGSRSAGRMQASSARRTVSCSTRARLARVGDRSHDTARRATGSSSPLPLPCVGLSAASASSSARASAPAHVPVTRRASY